MVWLSLLSPPTHPTPSPTHRPLAPRTENPWHNKGKHLKILDFVYLPTRSLLCNGSQLTRVATMLHTAGRAWSLVACSVPPDIPESSITATTVSKETEAQAESVICPWSAGEETAVWLHVTVSIRPIPSSWSLVASDHGLLLTASQPLKWGRIPKVMPEVMSPSQETDEAVFKETGVCFLSVSTK